MATTCKGENDYKLTIQVVLKHIENARRNARFQSSGVNIATTTATATATAMGTTGMKDDAGKILHVPSALQGQFFFTIPGIHQKDQAGVDRFLGYLRTVLGDPSYLVRYAWERNPTEMVALIDVGKLEDAVSERVTSTLQKGDAGQPLSEGARVRRETARGENRLETIPETGKKATENAEGRLNFVSFLAAVFFVLVVYGMSGIIPWVTNNR
jgi:hypothetical protein